MSTLVLTMVHAPAGIRRETRYIVSEKFTIGRDADNDWVLIDPACKLSRRHCVFERDGQDWSVIDVSRNGVGYAHHTEDPTLVATMRRARVGLQTVQNGDMVHIGEYTLSVSLQEDESSFRIMPLPSAVEDIRTSLLQTQSRDRVVSSTLMAHGSDEETAILPCPLTSARRSAVQPQLPDPLLEMLGLAQQAIPEQRKSLALYRIASALEVALRGLHDIQSTMLDHFSHDIKAIEASDPFGPGRTKEDILRWIAGLEDHSPTTPTSAIEKMCRAIQDHNTGLMNAHRETAKALVDLMDPDKPDTLTPSGCKKIFHPWSWPALRRRHHDLRENLDALIKRIFRESYYRKSDWVDDKHDPERQSDKMRVSGQTHMTKG